MAPVPPNHVVGQGCECGCLMRRLDSVEVFNSMQEPVHVTVVGDVCACEGCMLTTSCVCKLSLGGLHSKASVTPASTSRPLSLPTLPQVCENRYGQEMEDQLIMPGESYHFQKKIIQRANARPVRLLCPAWLQGGGCGRPRGVRMADADPQLSLGV